MYPVDYVLGGAAEEEGGGAAGEALAGAAGHGGEGGGGGHQAQAGEGLQGLEEEGGLLATRRGRAVAVVGLLWIAPVAGLHAVDPLNVKVAAPETSQNLLQSSLLKVYLDNAGPVRGGLSAGDLTMAMMRDAREAVDGLMRVLHLNRALGQLGFALVFVLAVNSLAVLPLTIYPLVSAICLTAVEDSLLEASEAAAGAENRVAERVTDMMRNYRMTADYAVRPFVADRYDEALREMGRKEMEQRWVVTNRRYLPQ